MKVNILGIDYEIKEVDEISKTQTMLGLIDYIEQIIYIKESLSVERKQEVLIHEITHGVLELIGLDEELEEKDVQTLGLALYNLLTFNESIFSFSKVFEKEQNQQQI